MYIAYDRKSSDLGTIKYIFNDYMHVINIQFFVHASFDANYVLD